MLLYNVHLIFIRFWGLLSMKAVSQTVLSAHEYRIIPANLMGYSTS